MKAVRLSVFVVLLLTAVTGAASAKSVAMVMYSNSTAGSIGTGFEITYIGESVTNGVSVCCNFVYYSSVDDEVYLGKMTKIFYTQYETQCFAYADICFSLTPASTGYGAYQLESNGIAYFYTDIAGDGLTVTADFLVLRTIVYSNATGAQYWCNYPETIVSDDAATGDQTLMAQYMSDSQTDYYMHFAIFPLTLFDGDTINDFDDSATDGDGTALDEWQSISGTLVFNGWNNPIDDTDNVSPWNSGTPLEKTLADGELRWCGDMEAVQTGADAYRSGWGFLKVIFEPDENCPPAAFYGVWAEQSISSPSQTTITPFKPEW